MATGKSIDFLNAVKFIKGLDLSQAKALEVCRKQKKRYETSFEKWRDGKGDSLLHIATKRNERQGNVVDSVLEICPKLVLVRNETEHYRGMIPLHIAISKGDRRLFDSILKCTLNTCSHTEFKNLINCAVTGTVFRKQRTVLMGEIPLFVAALGADEYMVDKLLQEDVLLLFRTNSKQDTIFHALVKYAGYHRDMTESCRAMIAFFVEKIKAHYPSDGVAQLRYLMFHKNDKSCTPLDIAVNNGITVLFKEFMSIDKVYRRKITMNEEDEFEEFEYDISDFDAIAKWRANGSNSCCTIRSSNGRTESILDLLNYQTLNSDNIALLGVPPVKTLIRRKWKKFKSIYYTWGVFHFLFMVLHSYFAISHAEVTFVYMKPGNTTQIQENIDKLNLIRVSRWLVFSYGLFLMFIASTLIIAKIRSYKNFRYFKQHIYFILFMLIYSISIFVDTIMYLANNYQGGIATIISIITGWWFVNCFLRGWKYVGFLVSMIKKVIVVDFVYFFVILFIQVTAFTVIMIVLYRGKDTPHIGQDEPRENLDNNYLFRKYLFTMFYVCFGLTDATNQGRTEVNWLTYVAYVSFVLTTFILFVNFLVATMTATWASMHDFQTNYWRQNQADIVLLIETFLQAVLPTSQVQKLVCGTEDKTITMHDPIKNVTTPLPRFFIRKRQNLLKSDSNAHRMEDVEDMLKIEESRSIAVIVSPVEQVKHSRQPQSPPPSDVDKSDDETDTQPELTITHPIYHESFPSADDKSLDRDEDVFPSSTASSKVLKIYLDDSLKRNDKT